MVSNPFNLHELSRAEAVLLDQLLVVHES